MSEGSSTKEIVLGDELGDIAVKANGVRVEIHTDGSIVAYTKSDVDAYTNGAVHVHAAANDDAKAMAAPKVGAIEISGDHKGEIYGGIYPADNKPIWFSAAPKVMDHYKAAAWAQGQGGSLPTRKQGDYLTTLKGKGGAFTELFNRGTSFPAGYVWLAEPVTDNRNFAWCQRLSVGDQHYNGRFTELPVLSVWR
jgi:hypothetical protein